MTRDLSQREWRVLTRDLSRFYIVVVVLAFVMGLVAGWLWW